jgi:hypothetical protein
VQHPVIDDHRHDFERRDEAHRKLLQVLYEDIGVAMWWTRAKVPGPTWCETVDRHAVKRWPSLREIRT